MADIKIEAKNEFLNKEGLRHYDEKIKGYINEKAPQGDWEQTDSTKADYIKNKPELGALAVKDEVVKADLSADLQTAIDRVDFANGGTMGGSLIINGDLTVNGKSTTVETFNENVNVEDNTITLRHNATTGLQNEDYTGIIAHNYDGTTDGMLVFDNNGTAYVGDAGDLQPLATRSLFAEDNGELVSWNAANQTLVKAPVKVENIVTKDNFDSLNTVLSTNTNNAEMSYVKDVPADSANYAAVQKVGGMTYKDGGTLRSAKVTEVKSVGVNKYCGTEITEKTGGGVTYTWNETEQTITWVGTTSGVFETFIPLKHPIGLGGGTYTMKCEIMENESTTSLLLGVCDFSHPYDTTNGYSNLASIGATKVYTFAQDANVNYIHIYGSGAGTFNAKFKVMLNKGSTALPYSPYQERTLPILPEEVRPANGINENVYDYIEWAEDGSVKQGVRCGVVDLGTLDWTYRPSDWYGYSLFLCVLDSIKPAGDSLCALYEGVNSANEFYQKDNAIYLGNIDTPKCINIRTEAYTDAATFKAAMSGVMLVYELATPIVTDISDLITADNLIGVEGGGTITMVNEYEYAVPSEVVFYNEKAEAIAADKIVGNLIGVATRAISDEDGNSITGTYLKKSNVFEVISDVSGTSIKVGNTVVSEAQLQKLIAFIDAVELS